MKIILSPAKKMRVDTDTLAPAGMPVYLDKAQKLLEWLKEKDYDTLKTLWSCSDAIAQENCERLAHMNLSANLTPALLSYEGIAYQYMAPAVFEDGQYDYVQAHLRILSAFYGVLAPMDGVTPYRLEMQAKASVDGHKNLYDFWGDALYKAVRDDSGIIVNLASKEYSKCIEKYLTPEDTYITCHFVELSKTGKLAVKATYAKMARGEMVRYMAEHKVQTPEALKGFCALGNVFREDLSDDKNYF
ncbi:MAG: peroxide stress protein YaaA, partial [Eubacterium sp.]|nr:peroxide stress protein YaaA [Eubacterium sp.]